MLSAWKGAAAGLVGGIAGSWAMNQFQALWSRRVGGIERSHGAQSLKESRDDDDATMKLASAVSKTIMSRTLGAREKDSGGTAIHYAFGAMAGGIYGALAEGVPAVAENAGLPFGAALWLAADMTAIPALGLAKPPREYPLWKHEYALASHLVYGLTAEGVRRLARKAFR